MKTVAEWKPSPSMAVALLALFVALGGSAIAAKSGVFKVRSKNIVNGQVKTPDLRKNAVTSAKIRNGQVRAVDIGGSAVGASELAPGAVGVAALQPGAVGSGALAPGSVDGSKVQDNSLTGADIDESTLSGVDAASLDGAKRCGVARRVTVSAGDSDTQTLCTVGPFTLSALCLAYGGTNMLGAILMTTSEKGFYSTDAVKSPPAEDPALSNPDLEAGEEPAIVWHEEFEEGDGGSVSPPVVFNAFASSGRSISGQASVRADSAAGGARICDFVLSAFG